MLLVHLMQFVPDQLQWNVHKPRLAFAGNAFYMNVYPIRFQPLRSSYTKCWLVCAVSLCYVRCSDEKRNIGKNNTNKWATLFNLIAFYNGILFSIDGNFPSFDLWQTKIGHSNLQRIFWHPYGEARQSRIRTVFYNNWSIWWTFCFSAIDINRATGCWHLYCVA